MGTEARAMPFLFVGNQLCLDFLNTEIIENGQRISLIRSYDDLKAWLLAAGAVDSASRDSIDAHRDEEEKEQVVQQALALRAILRNMAEQITAGQAVSDGVLDALNGWLKQRKGYPTLSRAEGGYEMIMRYAESANALLAPIAESAAELLAHSDLRLIRKCENPQCILYFYDNSKNHARRWCSMDLCGNRSKVAAHYRRSRHIADE